MDLVPPLPLTPWQPYYNVALHPLSANYVSDDRVDENDERLSWKNDIPRGFKFQPTDQELLLDYLRRKVLDLPITYGIIFDVDVYQFPPDSLKEKAIKHDNGRMYFFTYLKKKDNSDKKNERSVRNVGFWKATQKHAQVFSEDYGSVIGTRTPLTFYRYLSPENNSKRESKKEKWLMQEYRLASNNNKSGDGELALCVVYYYQRKND